MDTYYFYTEGLTVGYHGVPLIKDIRIGLKKGEILTLIGPNGAGKTTILKSIIRQLAPLGGVAVLDGKAMGDLSGKELSQKLSVVLTERIHPEMMTCRDVVSTGRYPYTGKFGVLSGEDWAVVDEAMDLVHIHELADRDYTKTSDGQKQRVMLARALCQQPDIITNWNSFPLFKICHGQEICLSSCPYMNWIWQAVSRIKLPACGAIRWIGSGRRRRFSPKGIFRSCMA